MNKVLLVEDDAVLMEMYKDKLVHDGFEVETAVDGEEALEKWQVSQPDVVLLDLIMPKVTGFDVLKRVKDNPSFNKIPVLVLTNIFADSEDLIKNWGAARVILKANTTPEDIVKKVHEILQPKS